MTKCPACGNSVEEKHPSKCSSCGMSLKGATESFTPVSAPEEGLAEDTVPDSPVGPVLVVRKGAEAGGRFFIDRARLSVGRDPGCDIFLNDVTVSRSHAVLELCGSEVSIEDVGSLNGTYVNAVRVEKIQLADGDIVQIGKFQMVFMNRGGS